MRSPSAPDAAPAPAPDPSRHFLALDGLRGVAILMVLTCHYGNLLGPTGWEERARQVMQYGATGVDLFFVLSGFLITRILVQTRDDPDYLRNFYGRRMLRIFPLYYAFLAVVLVVKPVLRWLVAGRPLESIPGAAYYWAYLSNWPVPRATGERSVDLLHLWSLAIEEQFYMAWPLVVLLVPARRLWRCCAVGAVAAPLVRLAMMVQGGGVEAIGRVHDSTLARVDTLLLGALAALIELSPAGMARFRRRARPALVASAGLAAATYAAWYRQVRLDLICTAGWSILATFFALVVLWAASIGSGNRVLIARPLRSLGKYSYGIYLLHLLTVPCVEKVLPGSTPLGRLAIIAASFGMALVLARLSWTFVEEPFLRHKARFAYRGRSGAPIGPRGRPTSPLGAALGPA